MKKALSDVPFWFRYVFWWFLFFLLPWFAFPVPFHGDILIFPFSNGVFMIFVLLQVAPCNFGFTFLGCQKQCWISDLGQLSALHPVFLVSQAGAEVLICVSLGSFFSCSVLGFGCSCSAWQWCYILGCLMAAPAASPSYFKMFIYIK